MKQCCEYLRGLWYTKLQMMGIPCVCPAYIHGANQSVLASCGIPDSILKKKSQNIAYHFVREGAARDEWRTSYVNTHDNEADLLTKLLPSGEKRKGFLALCLRLPLFVLCWCCTSRWLTLCARWVRFLGGDMERVGCKLWVGWCWQGVLTVILWVVKGWVSSYDFTTYQHYTKKTEHCTYLRKQ